MNHLFIWVSVVFGVLRVWLVFSEWPHHAQKSFEAFAHIWVGMLIVFTYWRVEGIRPDLTAACFWCLVIVEVICAALTVMDKLTHGGLF